MGDRRCSSVVLRLRDVCRLYGRPGGEQSGLRGVCAQFEAGTLAAVCGPSGSGKSTLLMCAAGLTRPASGTIELCGERIEAASERQLTRIRRDQVGFVFQNFQLIESLTALENIYLPARLAGRRIPVEHAVRLLEQVGLSGRAEHRPAELSGGEQQRVAIARALVAGPSLLFADEPTGALDGASREQILALLREVTRASGVCVVVVTHDPVVAESADRVLVLVDGVLVEELTGASRDEIARRTVARA
ncbi:MAG: putative transport system ATP-binding protein [Actinomycetota bacterium]|nr:putative transport system ATP-binding protein [Actinomycetota bacterium]